MTKPAHTTPPPDAAARRRAPPVLAYSVEQLPSFDAAFYNRTRAELSKVAELTVPPRDAKALEVSAGHLFRIVSVEGPQVGDLNLWNAHDLTERFYSGKTRPEPDFDDRQGQVYRAPSQAGPGNDFNAGSPGFQKAPTRSLPAWSRDAFSAPSTNLAMLRLAACARQR